MIWSARTALLRLDQSVKRVGCGKEARKLSLLAGQALRCSVPFLPAWRFGLCPKTKRGIAHFCRLLLKGDGSGIHDTLRFTPASITPQRVSVESTSSMLFAHDQRPPASTSS